MQFLAFQLYAPLASFGEPAVGEARPSHTYPGRSAVLGLLAAALGIRRDEEARLSALRDTYGISVAVYSEGSLLRDYHTTQVPSAKDLKKRPHQTRSDELTVSKHRLNTILSTRDYRQDAHNVILIWQAVESAPQPLSVLRGALLTPRFTLYLGRKTCPPALPLHPQLVDADTLSAALTQADFPAEEALRNSYRLRRLSWEDRNTWVYRPAPGLPTATLYSVPRKDEPLSRHRWQFADRREHIALIEDSTPRGGALP